MTPEDRFGDPLEDAEFPLGGLDCSSKGSIMRTLRRSLPLFLLEADSSKMSFFSSVVLDTSSTPSTWRSHE